MHVSTTDKVLIDELVHLTRGQPEKEAAAGNLYTQMFAREHVLAHLSTGSQEMGHCSSRSALTFTALVDSTLRAFSTLILWRRFATTVALIPSSLSCKYGGVSCLICEHPVYCLPCLFASGVWLVLLFEKKRKEKKEKHY